MIEFDLSTQTAHIKFLDRTKTIEDEDPLFMFDDNTLEMTIQMEALLDCPRPHKYYADLKGFYYDRQLRTFFIFIMHYYLQIGEDLVKNDFRLFGDGEYMKHAKSFEFESYEVAKSVLFDDSSEHWVRIAGKNETQLILYDQSFALSANSGGLVIKKRALNPAINRCQFQTLIVKNRVFCFERKYYYMINETLKMYAIQSMFSKTSIYYGFDDVMMFVFNYLEDKVIFMTYAKFYVIDYNSIVFDELYLTLKLEPSDELVARENCFFVECEEPTSVTNASSILPVPEKKAHGFFDWLKSSYQFLIVGVVLLALVIAFFLLQNHRNKELGQDSRDPELIKMSSFGEDKNLDKLDDRVEDKGKSDSDKSKSSSKSNSKRNGMEEELVHELVQIPNLNRIEPIN